MLFSRSQVGVGGFISVMIYEGKPGSLFLSLEFVTIITSCVTGFRDILRAHTKCKVIEIGFTMCKC